jgi:hypothetical protein
VFEAVAATRNEVVNFTGRGDPRRLPVASVSSSFFAVGGVAPAKGRAFTPEEDRDGAPRVAVISDALWHSVFDGRDDALGQTLILDDNPTTVIGVMPATFTLAGAAGAPGRSGRSAAAMMQDGRRPSRLRDGRPCALRCSTN